MLRWATGPGGHLQGAGLRLRPPHARQPQRSSRRGRQCWQVCGGGVWALASRPLPKARGASAAARPPIATQVQGSSSSAAQG